MAHHKATTREQLGELAGRERLEVYWSDGGHCGPFEDFGEALEYAARVLHGRAQHLLPLAADIVCQHTGCSDTLVLGADRVLLLEPCSIPRSRVAYGLREQYLARKEGQC